MDAAINQSHQGAFPRSVRSQDGGVFAEVELKSEIVEHTAGLQPSFNGLEL